jgi:hypothetical protein
VQEDHPTRRALHQGTPSAPIGTASAGSSGSGIFALITVIYLQSGTTPENSQLSNHKSLSDIALCQETWPAEA